MAKPTVSEVDKKVAVIEQKLTDHIVSCEDIGERTLDRVKRLEMILLTATSSSLILLLKLAFFS
jgi:hypothetical protein|tara:strand:- start:587 stop:778 length:192 start_codon:yes stop_codon:yes gene_type:complete